MVVEMAMRSLATARVSLPPASSSPSSSSPSHSPTPRASSKTQFRPISASLPTSTTITLLALFSHPYEAKAVSLSKDQIVSSLTEVEKTIDQVQEAGSGFLDITQQVLDVVGKTLKPAIDAAFPIVQLAGEKALKAASPTISEASKKAQEVIQSSGFDIEPVVSAAKTVAGAAQQTTKVIEEAKPIASSTVETISSADPGTVLVTAGALFAAYLLFPPIWSVISFSLRGYKGELATW